MINLRIRTFSWHIIANNTRCHLVGKYWQPPCSVRIRSGSWQRRELRSGYRDQIFVGRWMRSCFGSCGCLHSPQCLWKRDWLGFGYKDQIWESESQGYSLWAGLSAEKVLGDLLEHELIFCENLISARYLSSLSNENGNLSQGNGKHSPTPVYGILLITSIRKIKLELRY